MSQHWPNQNTKWLLTLTLTKLPTRGQSDFTEYGFCLDGAHQHPKSSSWQTYWNHVFLYRKWISAYGTTSLVIVGENSCPNYWTSPKLDRKPVLTNSVTEILLKNDCWLYKIQNDNLDANLIDNTYVSQKQESHVSVHTFSLEET
jgi:hypothetical protein